MKEKNYLYHVVAICVSAVWGITFISTKTLINYGLTPTEIFTLRFAIAYVGMWFIAPRPLFCRSGADEFKMLLGGVTGIHCLIRWQLMFHSLFVQLRW